MRKILILYFLFFAGSVYSQDSLLGYIIPPPDDIVTDRPDQTESTDILEPGYVQIEGGVSNSVSADDSFTDLNLEFSATSISGLIRIGVFPNMELRISPEYSIFKSTANLTNPAQTLENKVDGFTPLTIGTKIKIIGESEKIPALSFLFHVDLPDVASKNFKGGFSTPEVRLAISKQLDDRFSLGVNTGAIFDMGSRQTIGLYTVSLGADIVGDLGGFFEFYGFFEDESHHYLDGGLTYRFMKNLQADVSAGTGLTANTSDFFISGGLSVRLPR